MPTATRRATLETAPLSAPPRLRLADAAQPLTGVTYDSENYAMLNRPIETGRHAQRVMRYLRPHARDRLLEIGCRSSAPTPTAST
jgi:hypothetical protein